MLVGASIFIATYRHQTIILIYDLIPIMGGGHKKIECKSLYTLRLPESYNYNIT